MSCVSGAKLVSKVEISVSCRDLSDNDEAHLDPICVLYVCPPGTHAMNEHSRTEMLKDTLNPDFQHKFIVDFHFEEHQKVLLKVYNIRSSSARLTDHDFLGQLESSVGELVSRRRYEAPLAKSPKKGSTIIITCLEQQRCKEVLVASMSGRGLDRRDFLNLADPYIEIYKPLHNLLDASPNELQRAQWNLAYRSVHIDNTKNPVWQPLSIKLSTLCNVNKDLILKFKCMDWNKRRKHTMIGEFHASVQQLLDEAAGSASGAECQRTLTSAKGKPAGVIVFEQLRINTEDSFIDYIEGGCELDFTVAIDFTASNGNPLKPGSLHYIDPNGHLNQYELAIVSIGEVVQDYNSTRDFPALGFGAIVPTDNNLSHCFPLNFNQRDPRCAGLQGLLQAYRNCVRNVTLYGPTNFSPVIEKVMQEASLNQSGKKFCVLLMITDGIITDFYETKHRIVEASKLPMAIIIVGVGQEDFSAMVELDSDDKRLQVNGKVAEADIVQFVPLRDFLDKGSSTEYSKSALAKAVLEELPDQLCGWMRKRGIKAGPPRERPQHVVGGFATQPLAVNQGGPQAAQLGHQIVAEKGLGPTGQDLSHSAPLQCQQQLPRGSQHHGENQQPNADLKPPPYQEHPPT